MAVRTGGRPRPRPGGRPRRGAVAVPSCANAGEGALDDSGNVDVAAGAGVEDCDCVVLCLFGGFGFLSLSS